jgi:hypothetical protein
MLLDRYIHAVDECLPMAIMVAGKQDQTEFEARHAQDWRQT